VVTKSVGDYSVVGGIPASVLRKYDERIGKWEKRKDIRQT